MYLSLSRFPSSFKDTSHVELGTNLMMSPFFFNDLIIYFIFVVLGLCCCTGKLGLLFIVVHGLLIAVVSLVAKHAL